MKLSRTGLRILTKQYRSVLKKCMLINAGLLLFAASAGALEYNNETVTVTNPIDEDVTFKGNITIDDQRITFANHDFIFDGAKATIKDANLETDRDTQKSNYDSNNLKGNIYIKNESELKITCPGGKCSPTDDEDGFLGFNVSIDKSKVTAGEKDNLTDNSYIGANHIFQITNGSEVTLNGSSVLAYEGDAGEDDGGGKGEFVISNSTVTLNDNAKLNIGEEGNDGEAKLTISDSTITLNNNSEIKFTELNKADTNVSNAEIFMNGTSKMNLNALNLTDSTITIKENAKLTVTNVELMNSSILSDNNEVTFEGEVFFNGLFDPAIANIKGNLTRDGYDDEITYNLNSGTLKYTSDKYLYDEAKHSSTYVKNSIIFNGGTLDLANGKASDIKLSNLTLSSASNIHLDADLANKKMDTLTADTIVANATLNIAKLNLISDATEETTEINFTQNSDLQSKIEYTGTTSGLTALSPIYSYDVAYDNTNGNFTFTRGGGNAVSDYNPAVYSSSVVGQSISFLQQNIANTAFSNISTPVPSQGIASGDMPKTNNAWVSMIGFDDNVDFDSFQTVDSEMYSVVGGVNSNDIDLKSGTARVGVYAGYLDGEQKYSGNKIKQSGGYVGLNSSLRNGNAVLANTVNAGYIRNEAQHSFGTDKYDTYWAGIALKGGYDYHLNNGLTVQPNIYAGYSLVNNEDYTSKSGAKVENDNLHLFEVAPGVKVSKNLQNNWNVSAQAKYVFVMDNGGDINVDNAVLPNISTDDYVEYGLGIDKTLNDNWELSADINRRDGGREGWNGNISFKYNF